MCLSDAITQCHDTCWLAFCINMLFYRCGHGSCRLSDGSIIIVGGYGESSVAISTPHSRLNDVMKLTPTISDGWKLCTLDTQGTCPGENTCCSSSGNCNIFSEL